MGARLFDWIAANSRECVAFFLGIIVGGVFSIIGAYMAK